jgi:hypothetical protein
MKTLHTLTFAAIAALSFTALAAQSTAQCTSRDCLIELADDYLAALVAHDSSRLPLSPEIRFVENVERK